MERWPQRSRRCFIQAGVGAAAFTLRITRPLKRPQPAASVMPKGCAAWLAAGTAGQAGAQSGLAFRILEAGYRLNMPRMFAALLMLTGTGVAIFGLTSFAAWLVLHRWHESSLKREN